MCHIVFAEVSADVEVLSLFFSHQFMYEGFLAAEVAIEEGDRFGGNPPLHKASHSNSINKIYDDENDVLKKQFSPCSEYGYGDFF